MNDFLRMCFNIITQIGPYLVVLLLLKLVDCLEKCLIYGHIRRFAD